MHVRSISRYIGMYKENLREIVLTQGLIHPDLFVRSSFPDFGVRKVLVRNPRKSLYMRPQVSTANTMADVGAKAAAKATCLPHADNTPDVLDHDRGICESSNQGLTRTTAVVGISWCNISRGNVALWHGPNGNCFFPIYVVITHRYHVSKGGMVDSIDQHCLGHTRIFKLCTELLCPVSSVCH